MYDDGYGYHHATCCGACCQYHCYYERKLLRRSNWLSHRDGYWWHCTVYLQLEYDTGADGRYRYRPGRRYLYRHHYGWGRVYHHDYGDHHPAGNIFVSVYNCPDQCE